MLLTVIAYAMIIVFMYVIMTKKLSPFTSLVMIPLLFAIIAYSPFFISPLCLTLVCLIRLRHA